MNLHVPGMLEAALGKIPFYTYQMRMVGFSKRSHDFLLQNVPQQRENEAGTKGVSVLLLLAQPLECAKF